MTLELYWAENCKIVIVIYDQKVFIRLDTVPLIPTIKTKILRLTMTQILQEVPILHLVLFIGWGVPEFDIFSSPHLRDRWEDDHRPQPEHNGFTQRNEHLRLDRGDRLGPRKDCQWLVLRLWRSNIGQQERCVQLLPHSHRYYTYLGSAALWYCAIPQQETGG